MTAAEKQNVAAFLDLAGDFILSGYRGENRDYNFNDDVSPAAAEEGTINTQPYEASSVVPPSSGSASAPQTGTLETIAEEIRACKNCPLCQERINAAPGEGSKEPLVMVIGEGPGADEDEQGRPFVGKAGQLLDKMLSSIELSRNTNCFIANMVKCRPPNNRDPRPEEMAACAHFLRRQINLLKPKFILVLGRVASQALLNTTEPITRLHGHFIDYKIDDLTIPLFVTYHPAALLRNEELKRPTWEDLKLFRSKLGF